MSRSQAFHVFEEPEIRAVATDHMALDAAEDAFAALGRGLVTVPEALGWEFPEVRGEAHVKGAHVHGSELFVCKVATGFFGNVEFGVPTGSGLVIVFDATTGFPKGLLVDNGHLTDLRTAAAGALAARLLTAAAPLRVAVVGTGVQAHLQIRVLEQVREIATLTVWGRNAATFGRFAEAMAEDVEVEPVFESSLERAVAGADLVITATASRAPLVRADWVQPSATVIAVGSDSPLKQELTSQLVARADKVVTDLTPQSARLGELRHAVEADLMGPDDVYAELGRIVIGEVPGREASELIVCDLTGVGAQDATLAERVFKELTARSAADRYSGLGDAYFG